jgi:photosystem II stability/assembly factor-like uncharacterized protein/predicted RNA-binding protein with TRAM domain
LKFWRPLVGALLCIPAAVVAIPGGSASASPNWGVEAAYADYPQPAAVACPSTSMCVAEGLDSILTTTSGGATWNQQTEPGLGAGGVSCPTTSQCVVVGGTEIFTTSDGGVQWTSRSVPAGTQPLFSVSCPSSLVCVAVGGNIITSIITVLTSSDGGVTWTNSTPNVGVSVLSAVACASTTSCVATGLSGSGASEQGAIVTTSDGGGTWSVAPAPGNAQDFSGVSCPTSTTCWAVGVQESQYYAQPGVVVVSSNAGATWSLTSAQPGLVNDSSVSCIAAAQCTISGATSVGAAAIEYTTDGGTTWSAGSATGQPLTALACPSSATCFAVGPTGSTGRVVESGDGGASWNTITTFGLTQVTAVSCGSSTDCVAVAAGDFLVTDNGGATWMAVNFPIAGVIFYGLSCPTATDCVALGWVNSVPVAYFSSDGGNTWTAGALPAIPYSLTGVSCLDALHCYGWGTAEAVRTSDGGHTWTQVTQPAGDLPVDVSCPSAQHCVAAGSGGGALLSTDGGASWTDVALPSGVAIVGGVDCPTASVCYAPATDQQSTETGAILESSDGGDSWSVELTPAGTDRPSQVSCVTPTECVAVGNYSDPVLATSDGLTWTAQPLPQFPYVSDTTGTYAFGGLGVSCVPETLCVVVGGDEAGGLILGQEFSSPAPVPPGAPLDAMATPYNGEAAVSFSPPASDGGTAITAYTVTASDQTDPAHGGQTATGGSSPITVAGLSNGDSYTFTVTATNSSGTGPASAPSAAVVPITVPSQPVEVAAVATPGTVTSPGSATVSFSPPASTGGSPVTSYTVTAADQTDPAHGGQTATGGSSPITVAGLSKGDSYTFTVSAANSAGSGPPSSPSTPVTMPTIPGTPEITGTVAGNGEVTVSFLSAGNGGSPVTSYQVNADDLTDTSNGGQTASGSSSPITVTGLNNGDSYSFTISACNAVGCSPTSPPADSVLPATSPSAPTVTNVVAGNTQASVSFSAPASNGGSPVTSYEVTADDQTSPARGGQTATGQSSPITVTGLTDGDTYTFTVSATNSVGTGSASTPSNSIVPPVSFVGVSVGSDGAVWVIGTNPVPGGYGIYHRVGNGWNAVPGGAVTIAVDPAGNPWVTNSQHQIFHWTGTAWTPVAGGATDISVGSNGAVWVIGTNPVPGGYGMYHRVGNGWTGVAGGAVTIAVDPAGNPWVTNSQRQIYHWTGTAWTPVSGN